MGRSEKETRLELIDPRLAEAHWTDARVEREFPYKKGRIRLIGEQTVRDEPQFVDYLLREEPRGLILAVVEAKDEDHGPGAGLQQALAYAVDLDVAVAYSSNGHGIVEHDRLTNKVTKLDAFPTPMQLLDRLRAGRQMRGPTVANSRGSQVPNPLIAPAYAVPGGGGLRYYQERAVTAAIEQMLLGRRRALLALATGTGKTFIGFSVAWKLLQTQYAGRVLFLADRISLRDQAYNEFSGFGAARSVVTGTELPLQRDIHFATYQTLYSDHPDGGRLYERYPTDFFDLVIIDECHRSGYGDWRVILDYFDSAFHLGMTATPKRTDSIDTYEFFAGENCDAEGEPQPAYEYSMGRGIDDGFLATYRVHRIKTNIDKRGLHIGEEISRGAELIVPAGAQPQDVYRMAEFEKEIVVPDRTKVLCEHLASRLRSLGVNDKTVVFCVTMEHAEQVRNELQTLLGPETGKQLYAARIVSEERDAQPLLEQFQLSTSQQPVVATTVDLLSTGVNVPALRNIVFMKPIGSVTVFKQIVGRGSRIDETTGKEFFRIIDYTDATRLFDDWDLPPPPSVGEQPTSGQGLLHGRVLDAETSTPIEGASIVIRVGMRQIAELVTNSGGEFSASGLPEIVVQLVTGAAGYGQRTVRALATQQPEETLIELRVVRPAAERITISGVEVTIAEEMELVLGGDGSELTVEQYIDYAGEQIRTTAGDMTTLAELWRDPDTRERLREQLRERRVDPELLALLLKRSDADDYDLLAHVGFDARIRTREERARRLEHLDADFIAGFDEKQQAVIRALIDKYRLAGIEEIASADVFRLPPFVDEFGGVRGLVDLFGGADQLAHVLRAIQAHLYNGREAA